MPAFYLGIDTGGTFTDGVLLDPASGRILAACKVPTTHQDLTLCIRAVLEQLLQPGVSLGLVSLSTTLATNAIAEGKNRPVALFLLGYDRELVEKFELDRELPAGQVSFISGGHTLEGREQAPLDEAGLLAAARQALGAVEAFAVSGYAGVVNPAHEERAGELLAGLAGLPVVQGHHLTSQVGSIRRAATAAINASLIPEAYAFLGSVEAMLKERGVTCPLVMVRGDGSLAGAEFAARRPVEIIHSGPATSAIGGAYLAGVEDALVVDVGGTTTDLALVHAGRTLLDGGRATVGGYQTCVRTIHARSFGLGGDSLVHFDLRQNLQVGPERVIPLARVAHEYPETGHEMRAWLRGAPSVLYSDRLEYWLLLREPASPPADPRVRKALDLLRGGPKRVGEILKHVGAVSPLLLERDSLVRRGVIARCALTPTDLLHVSGEYAPWDAEAALLAAETAARLWGRQADWLAGHVKRWMAERIAAEIVQFLSGRELETAAEDGLGRWLFDENLSPANPHLGCRFELKLPLVGIGAPARVFLPPLERLLGARVVFPEHYQVANAVGTVVGNILVRHEAEISPFAEGGKIAGYTARAPGCQERFTTRGEAVQFARRVLAELAREQARRAGAADPALEFEEVEGVEGFLRVAASAIGKP